jgi:multicomponent K+:H+ antiporter subunit G
MIAALEIITAILLVGGGLFGLIGSWGLLRLTDPMQRLHAPTKASTLGVGSALIAAAVSIWLASGDSSWREVLVAVFIFVTAPLSAIMLAKTHLFKTIDRNTLPPPGNNSTWATFAADRPAKPAIPAET